MKPQSKNTEGRLDAGYLSGRAIILIGIAFLFPAFLFAVAVTDDTGGDLTYGSDVDTDGDDVTLTDTGGAGTDSNFVTFSGNVVTKDGLFTFTRRGDLTISGDLITKDSGDVSITDAAGAVSSTTTFSGKIDTEGGDFFFDRDGDLVMEDILDTTKGSNSGNVTILGTGDSTFDDIDVQHGTFTFNRTGDATFKGDIDSNQGDINVTGGDLVFEGDVSTNQGDFTVNSTGDITLDGDIQTNGGTVTITGTGTTTVNGDIEVGNNGELILDSGTLIVDPDSNVADGVDITFDGGTFNTNDSDITIDTLTLTDDSYVDLDTGTTSSVFEVDDVVWDDPTKFLYVLNYDFNSGVGVDDIVRFNVDLDNAAGLINQLVFIDPTGFAAGTYTAILDPNSTSGFEYIPGVILVPETPTIFTIALLGMVAGADFFRRRKIAVISEKTQQT